MKGFAISPGIHSRTLKLPTRTHVTRPAPLRLAIRQALFCSSLGLATLPLAHATDSASTATRYDLAIPAGSLDAALIALSRSTGLNIAFNPG